MEDKLKQIEQHIDWCIGVGLLPRNYKKTAEYKELLRQMRDDE